MRQLNEFLCWCPDYSEESNAKKVRAIEPEYAAEAYAERHHADLDWTEEMVVHVRTPGGEVLVFDVTVEMEPTARAVKRKEAESE
jgi:hypothetical protein